MGAAALLLASLGPPPAAAVPGAAGSVITVIDGLTLAAPDGQCSLIEAIHNANDTATGQPFADCAAGDPTGADEIELPANGLFVLSSAFDDEYGATGLPVISGAVTISGHGATIGRDPASEPFRLLAVAASGDLTLTDTTLTDGYAWVYIGQPYELQAGAGGGILSLGDLTINGSRIIANKALHDGGGVAVMGGQAVIEDSDVSSNYAGNGGGLVNQGDLTLRRSLVSDNRGYAGGGILNWDTLTLEGVVIHHNRSASGGGVRHYGGSALIADSLFHDNQAFGVNSSDEMVITGSTFTGNERGIGSSGPLTVANSTISGNQGSGLVVSSDLTRVRHSTITGNSAEQGGGIFVSAFFDSNYSNTCFPAYLELENSIVSGNEAADGPELYARFIDIHCSASVEAAGNVVGHDGQAGATHVYLGANNLIPAAPLPAILEPTLRGNGGPTPTHALPPGSPAIDRLSSAACEESPIDGVDQRGWLRNFDGDGQPSDDECDLGAVEWQPWPFAAFAPLVGGGPPVGGRVIP